LFNLQSSREKSESAIPKNKKNSAMKGGKKLLPGLTVIKYSFLGKINCILTMGLMFFISGSDNYL
jgi:hypothetical protein